MKTLYGGCGVEGCLDCLPLFVVEDDGMQHEIEITITKKGNA